MKRSGIAGLLALTLFLAGWAVDARAASSHYVNGTNGLEVAAAPPPGWYFRMSNLYYSADSVRDQNGDKVDIDFDMGAYMDFNTLIYSSDCKFLGGRYLASLIVPLVNIDVDVKKTFGRRIPDFWNFHDFTAEKDSSSFGLSDVVVEPVMLFWDFNRVTMRADFAVFMPTGEYDRHDPSSPGRGFWTFMPGFGATWYIDQGKTWSASIMSYYEFHTEQRQTNVTPGQHFHFEWGVGKRFAKYWQAGAAGYAAWQVTDDRGDTAGDDRTKAFAVGPELNVAIPKWKADLSLRSVWEFNNRSNAQGTMTALTLTKAF